MARKLQDRTSTDSEILERTLSTFVDKLAEKIGNGGTKLDERLTKIAELQQQNREETIQVREKVQNLHDVVMEDIKPSIKRLDDQIQHVEYNVGKPCAFHETITKQLTKLSELELKYTELQQKHNNLKEQVENSERRVVADIAGLGNKLSSEISSLKIDVESVKRDSSQIKTSLEVVSESGKDTKQWTKYIVTSVVSMVFAVATSGLIQLFIYLFKK